jgi:hypothetical protein
VTSPTCTNEGCGRPSNGNLCGVCDRAWNEGYAAGVAGEKGRLDAAIDAALDPFLEAICNG